MSLDLSGNGGVQSSTGSGSRGRSSRWDCRRTRFRWRCSPSTWDRARSARLRGRGSRGDGGASRASPTLADGGLPRARVCDRRTRGLLGDRSHSRTPLLIQFNDTTSAPRADELRISALSRRQTGHHPAFEYCVKLECVLDHTGSGSLFAEDPKTVTAASGRDF